MNGDEVRRLVLPRASWGLPRDCWGYAPAAVDELLDRVATELDAGRPVAPLIETTTFPLQKAAFGQLVRGVGTYPRFLTGGGYDSADVDGVLSQLRREDDPAARADPWRDLPAWRYHTGGQNGDGASSATRAVQKGTVRDYVRACADAWRDFGLQPGTQVCRVKTRPGHGELRIGGQPALVCHGQSFSLGGRTYKLSGVKAAQVPAIAAEISAKPAVWTHIARDAAGHDQAARNPWGLRSLADQAGQPVLYTTDGYPFYHRDRDAKGYVQFPGQRWLRFPVRGTQRSNAIMTAVDQAGRQVARYRIASQRAFAKWREIEITVHPDQQLTDDLLLTLALTAPWVSEFFDRSGGG